MLYNRVAVMRCGGSVRMVAEGVMRISVGVCRSKGNLGIFAIVLLYTRVFRVHVGTDIVAY